jgi:hypothetical protein
MTDVSQPRMARGRMLPAGILVTALFALLAFAPLASATSDPVASGSTTVTLNSGWTKYLKTFGIKIQKVSPAKVKGQKVTFTVTGGEIDPTNGLGSLTLGGGIKFKAGKKSTTVKGLVLDTAKNTLTGKVGGKKVKLATTSGLSISRNGFGVNANLKKLKLNNAGATQLNKALGFSKGNPKPFLKNKLIGKSASEAQPSTVAVIPSGNLTFTGAPVLFGKLKNVKANIETIAPTTQTGTVLTGPLLGGTVSPAATAGVVQSGLGVKLVQHLSLEPFEPKTIDTTITLGGMYLDLAAKTVTVEVVAESNAESPTGSKKFPLNLGNLGRSSIADLTVTGVTADPATRTVSVNSAAVLQPISAEVLQGFVSVYKAYIEGYTEATAIFIEGKNPAEAAAAGKAAGEEAAKNNIAAGEALGTFSFTAQTQ